MLCSSILHESLFSDSNIARVMRHRGVACYHAIEGLPACVCLFNVTLYTTSHQIQRSIAIARSICTTALCEPCNVGLRHWDLEM